MKEGERERERRVSRSKREEEACDRARCFRLSDFKVGLQISDSGFDVKESLERRKGPRESYYSTN